MLDKIAKLRFDPALFSICIAFVQGVPKRQPMLVCRICFRF